MKEIIKIAENENFVAVNIGKMSELNKYLMTHPKSGQKIEGKVFLKDATKSSGTEISYNMLPPRTELSYFHVHRKNEETYMILSGSGQFQVDDNCFEISEGSVIRVAPKGKRGMVNNSDEAMIYIVIQSKEGSLEEYTTDDGGLVAVEKKWTSS